MTSKWMSVLIVAALLIGSTAAFGQLTQKVYWYDWNDPNTPGAAYALPLPGGGVELYTNHGSWGAAWVQLDLPDSAAPTMLGLNEFSFGFKATSALGTGWWPEASMGIDANGNGLYEGTDGVRATAGFDSMMRNPAGTAHDPSMVIPDASAFIADPWYGGGAAKDADPNLGLVTLNAVKAGTTEGYYWWPASYSGGNWSPWIPYETQRNTLDPNGAAFAGWADDLLHETDEVKVFQAGLGSSGSWVLAKGEMYWIAVNGIAYYVNKNGDVQYDGWVDVGDLGILSSNWGPTTGGRAAADFNGDNSVDVGDLGILSANWTGGSPAPPTTGVSLDVDAVPAPAALGAGLALLGLAGLRRRR